MRPLQVRNQENANGIFFKRETHCNLAIFTANNTTSPSSGSIFGGASSPTSGGSMFGGTTSFGSPQPPTTGSVFGGSPFSGGEFSQTSSATTAAPAFGNSFSQATSNAPAFGATPAFGSPVLLFFFCA